MSALLLNRTSHVNSCLNVDVPQTAKFVLIHPVNSLVFTLLFCVYCWPFGDPLVLPQMLQHLHDCRWLPWCGKDDPCTMRNQTAFGRVQNPESYYIASDSTWPWEVEWKLTGISSLEDCHLNPVPRRQRTEQRSPTWLSVHSIEFYFSPIEYVSCMF